jgi:tetratricopeptide (TPR) repeat protein
MRTAYLDLVWECASEPVCIELSAEPIGPAGDEITTLLDHAVMGYAGARRDTRERLDAVLAADPTCVMAHCLDGYLHMLASKRDAMPRARAALARADAASGAVPPRERLHRAALDAWSRGDMRAAARIWDAVLDEQPRDLIALKVSQFVLSYLGESERMRYRVARVVPAWTEDTPGFGYVLGCYAYALEEAGDYARAEEMGRRAVSIDRADIWAAHAVAHVAEMQGRLHDGIDWIATLASEWRDCTNFALHLKWHESLYHLELEQYPQVLTLYDREVRAESTDEYLDVANAVSLLWRLEQAGVEVGPRWRELATRAASHLDDHALVFVDLHYLMALAAVDDTSAVAEFLASCERFAASGQGTEAEVMGEVGLPLARAVVAHRVGNYPVVVDELMPLRQRIRRIGASHAQRDLFEQLLIDAAWRGGRLAEADQLLTERLTRRPRNRWGIKHQRAVRAERRGAARSAPASGDLPTA